MKATATANANIALAKYWGQRDIALTLPANSSISMTLDGLSTKTTVEFSGGLKQDSLKIDGHAASREEIARTSGFLDIVRKMHGTQIFARVESENNFPKSAGLASSASGFAALALAATRALGMELDAIELSKLARRGSGSASRSVFGGFVEWKKGSREDGSDCYATPIAPKEHWPELKMIVAVLTKKEKAVSSEKGMQLTMSTSPLYNAWLGSADSDLEAAREAILEKDFNGLGKTAEMNCLKMHSTMLTTEPHLIYWEPETIGLMKGIMGLREDGVECYFTIDAGPQVKVLCLEKDAKRIVKYLSFLPGVKETRVCGTGEGARIAKQGLF
ncbi:Diphosphomevalonate decarboxylase [uncultured archaeon]|nr:Diphosphomevalonate decarboxylase [uncultured archaeon]